MTKTAHYYNGGKLFKHNGKLCGVVIVVIIEIFNKCAMGWGVGGGLSFLHRSFAFPAAIFFVHCLRLASPLIMGTIFHCKTETSHFIFFPIVVHAPLLPTISRSLFVGRLYYVLFMQSDDTIWYHRYYAIECKRHVFHSLILPAFIFLSKMILTYTRHFFEFLFSLPPSPSPGLSSLRRNEKEFFYLNSEHDVKFLL